MALVEVGASQSTISAEQARRLADEFAWREVGDLVAAGEPQRAVSPLGSVWAVPLILTNAAVGPVGAVGVAVVDDQLGQIVAWTPVDEIKAAAAKLFQSRGEDIWAAFRASLASAQL